MRRPSLKFLTLLAVAAAALTISIIRLNARPDMPAANMHNLPDGGVVLNSPVLKGSYLDYLTRHPELEPAKGEVLIEGEAYSSAVGMKPEILNRYEGLQGKAVKTGEEGSIDWSFHVEQEGFYNIDIRYFNVEGKGSDIERELAIDGVSPFSEAKSLVIHRIWRNETDQVERDGQGNDLSPDQVEVQKWQDIVLKDESGYNTDPYLFYMSKGKHTLKLTSIKEPLVIDFIKLLMPKVTPSYDETVNLYKNKGYEPASKALVKVQGEAAAFKSSPSLLPYNDRSNPAIEPFHVSKIRNNAMGGYGWRIPGQWIEWEVEAPADGLYNLAVKNRQNYLRGFSSLRKLTIDGNVPFEEAKQIGFPYGSAWKTTVLGIDGDNPYLFYLTKGKHRIRLEVTLGDLAVALRTVQSSILDLNAMYRKLISYTGTVPDPFRDYDLEKRIPEMTKVFREQSDLLYEVASYIDGSGGSGSDRTAMLKTLAFQLKDMAERPDTVPSRIDSFKGNVGGLGSWLLTTNEQPLTIDYLMLASPDMKLPKAEASTWTKMTSGMQSFAASFYEDYDQYGGDSGDSQSISVWITSGRDQAQVLKKMIDSSFTAKTGIHVNLKLVASDVLLSATVAGNGPDVALPVTNDVPVSYASRDALQDLSVFPGFEEVKNRFAADIVTPYEFNGQTFALPDQQTFPVMFYRKDILEDELKLKIPQTWDDLYKIIPTLQKHNLQFGFSKLIDPPGVAALPPNPLFSLLLYQNGGRFYADDQQASALDSETSMKAFKAWTELYVNYKLPLQIDFANRFRTGEMPIGISDYTDYNKLSVFAPEIKGLWSFSPVPGVLGADGTIHREVAGTGTAIVMFKKTKNKDAAWQFLDWWTSKETQIDFGRQMEIRLGTSARYPTANLEALGQLPWPTKDYKMLKEQIHWLRGIPEVPGGYFTGRHLDNAFRRVVVQGDDPRETLDNYINYINDEITIKRKEFKLPYRE
ncbi:extracellular solute-binding protein [Cohnella luojiensis]|uniref:Extracellular solute-binding protein n=1 Tax=Cohnella luojiensis TaxID=652876 RepID=A0A4Y8LUG2_9BACL|nr:extracellular solute-binding protein [Cohnella luojiensis]TFE25189.1 extracellular solute-binding protein [Cohnella luojiensis]